MDMFPPQTYGIPLFVLWCKEDLLDFVFLNQLQPEELINWKELD